MNTNSFVNAVSAQQNVGRTRNGALTHKSTQDHNLDLFFLIGNRKKDFTKEFDLAYAQDRELAIRTALWARDIRGGAGERDTSLTILQHIEKNYPGEISQILRSLPTFGRWDDLMSFTGEGRQIALKMFSEALRSGNVLAAKWAPGEKSKDKNDRNFYNSLRLEMGLTPRNYRKLLANLRRDSVVEVKMCSKRFDSIDYSKIPSLASARYQKAFGKNDPTRYAAYLASLQKGETKINASAVYPYDVIKSVKHGNAAIADQQWKALPNYMTDVKVLPMIDVSGSMECPVGDNKNLSCMDVAISLGIYAADKNEGPFKGMALTFHSTPILFKISDGTISTKYQETKSRPWGYSTNLEEAFKAILDHGVKNSVTAEDMPEMLLILSDMEFNQAAKVSTYNYHTGRYSEAPEDTLYDRAVKMYKDAGHDLPKIVFWNLNSRAGNMPVKFDTKGTALVSGFSPAILKAVLSGNVESFSPRQVMLDTLNVDRYNIW